MAKGGRNIQMLREGAGDCNRLGAEHFASRLIGDALSPWQIPLTLPAVASIS